LTRPLRFSFSRSLSITTFRQASGVNSNRAIFLYFPPERPHQKGLSEIASREMKAYTYMHACMHGALRSSFKCAHSSQKQRQALLCKCENETHKGCLLLSLSLARTYTACIQFHRRELHSGGAVASQFNHFIIPRERFCWHKVPPNYHKSASPLCAHGGRRRRDNSNNTSALAIIRLFIAFFRPCSAVKMRARPSELESAHFTSRSQKEVLAFSSSALENGKT
jgi:hypothetical protein